MLLACTSDWQLGPAGNRVDSATGLNSALLDRARCAGFVVHDAIERGADLILVAGDVFDSCRPDPTTVRMCRDALRRALDEGVPVLAIPGNHDIPKGENEKHALDLLRDTLGITIVDKPMSLGVWGQPPNVAIAPLDMIREPTTLDLQIACLPWPSIGRLLADEDLRKLEPGQLNLLVAEKMMEILRGLASQLIEGVPSLLLGHFGVDTAEMGSTSRMGMLGSEFVLNLHEISGLGFNAIILGHYHGPQVLQDDPFVAYCGSPECIDQGEASQSKRYLMLDTQDALVAGFAPKSFRTPHRVFVTIDIDEDHPDLEKMEVALGLKDAIVRVRIGATVNVSPRDIGEWLESIPVHDYTIDRGRITSSYRREVNVSAGMSVEEALTEWVSLNPDFEDMLPEMLEEAQVVEAGVGGEAP